MNILVLNSGSSSLKFQLIDTDVEKIAADADRRLARGVIERIGSQALIRFENADGKISRTAQPIRDHRGAIDVALRWLVSPEATIPGVTSLADIHAIGHRVVHGGMEFAQPARMTAGILQALEAFVPADAATSQRLRELAQ